MGTAVEAVAALVRRARGLRPTNTPTRLWWHGVGLGLAVIAVLVLSVATLGSVRHDAELDRDRISPALSDALAARAALSDADRAAWASFGSGSAALVGPGSDYQNDVTVAGQHLEHLAGLRIGDLGELGSVGGKLITYQSQVEQADASYRADRALSESPRYELPFAYLQYASNTLRAADGLLATMDQVIEDIRAESRAAGGASTAWLVVFAVAVAVSVALWVRAQRYLRRAFRRSVNLPLLGAVALLLALTGWLAAVTAHTGANLGRVRDELRPTLVDRWAERADDAGHRAAALRDAVARSDGTVPAENASPGPMSLTDITPLRDDVDARLAAASATFGLPVGQYAVSIGALALVWLGFWRHLREYEGWRR